MISGFVKISLTLAALLTCSEAALLPASTLLAQETPSTLPATFTERPIFWIPDAGSGWIGFDPKSDIIVIPVVLNGHPAKAMIDTGVDHLIVSKAYADAHHLPLTPWAKPESVGGPTQLYTTPSVTLDVGAIRTTKPGAVTVMDLRRLNAMGLADVEVVIGLPILGIFEWQVDQDHHRFRLLSSGSIPMADGIPIRVGPNNSRLVTDVSINGQPVSPTMIDTGSDSEVSISPAVAERTKFNTQTDIASVGAGGMAVQPLGRLTDFTLGAHKVSGAYATVEHANWWGSKEIQALIGMGVLRNYNMTVDLTAGRMLLEPRVPPSKPAYRSTSGIQGYTRNGRLSVAHVMSRSPAAAAKLKPGDAICAIDHKTVSKDLVEDYFAHAAPGTKHLLTLCDGTLRTITLHSFY
ncbi:aspartyl protease family protein [Sphingomonas yabuuchiae]|uniref:Aspartyl protease n=1 Tax=Sphingomonas yabuuchiae TaxID=172044 RepID=A0AA41A2M5_9SPHN|nr:aspartyl protease family protein [Sphingomonas yabuuchiae]MBB4610227.1 putative aspartyl protease [Sphingomonas yabuuchiae]MBN3560479.1 aspartyl protease family protein [Sphingomonas yabuuchiae]